MEERGYSRGGAAKIDAKGRSGHNEGKRQQTKLYIIKYYRNLKKCLEISQNLEEKKDFVEF